MERRMTPIMGWTSWNCFRTDIDEEKILNEARLLKESGLAAHGYEFFNIDDGYFGGRGKNGRLCYHKRRFPHGIKVIADYAHGLGLKAGCYSEAGDNTCGYYYDNEDTNGLGSGLYGHEESDLHQLLLEDDFDFIKVDWCGGLRLGLDEETQYTKIGNIIRDIEKKKGKPIVYNVCRWEFPGEWVVNVADSWRAGVDIAPDFESVIYQIDQMKALKKFSGPGHVNDCDMMQIGNGMTYNEDMVHFAMWCMLSAPLMISSDLSLLKKEIYDILTNDELIAIDQDALCKQGYVVKEYKDESGSLAAELWIKELENNSRAAALLNRSDRPLKLDFTMDEIGASRVTHVRNLINGEDLPANDNMTFTVEGHSIVVLRVSADAFKECRDVNENKAYSVSNAPHISLEKATELTLKGDARLIDVRNESEYDSGHYEHAINIPYQVLYLEHEELIPDKHECLIFYCATGKRAYMLEEHLKWLGYKNLYLTDSYY